jgi:hypothetical protein
VAKPNASSSPPNLAAKRPVILSTSSTSPPPGLHFHDVAKLLEVLFKLRASGNTLLVIEHNLDVIKTADWILDLGPEGGEGRAAKSSLKALPNFWPNPPPAIPVPICVMS